MKFGLPVGHDDPLGHPPCGGCGLKCLAVCLLPGGELSPSMRRVWIEIYPKGNSMGLARPVTLHAEGVD